MVDLLALLINHLLPKAFSYCSSAVSSNSKSVYYSLSLYEIIVIFEQLINVSRIAYVYPENEIPNHDTVWNGDTAF